MSNALNRLRDFVNQSTSLVSADGQTDENKAVAARLYETFEKDMAAADIKGLHFYVKNGSVTIYGTVRHELDRDLIITLTEQVAGVREVEDNLELAQE